VPLARSRLSFHPFFAAPRIDQFPEVISAKALADFTSLHPTPLGTETIQ
jgi:hypothetical protein